MGCVVCSVQCVVFDGCIVRSVGLVQCWRVGGVQCLSGAVLKCLSVDTRG